MKLVEKLEGVFKLVGILPDDSPEDVRKDAENRRRLSNSQVTQHRLEYLEEIRRSENDRR